MNFQAVTLDPGLYLVAVPIGNARDITLRALDVLAAAEVLAAEDTRSLRRLMEIHGIPLKGRKILTYHDHSGPGARESLLEAAEGRSVAYAPEAGTPMIADPGFQLVRAARERGVAVTAVPGASALLTSVVSAGLPSDRLLFAGFLPAASAQRRSALADLAAVPATLCLYESPKRLAASLRDMAAVLGNREAAVARELTKRFEEVRRGGLLELAEAYGANPPKGEVVVLITRAEPGQADGAELETALREALKTLRVKDAADAVAGALGLPRREVYQRALSLSRERD